MAAGRNYFHLTLFIYENDYFQFSQGLMPSDVWEAELADLGFYYDQFHYGEIMEVRKSFFSQGLIDIIESPPDKRADV